MFEIDKRKFGTFVAQLRKEKGYTQKELAERLFISDKAVSKWETAVTIPDTALLIPLAELLDVSVTELLLCERVKAEAPLETAQVETVVKTALSYAEERPVRAYQTKNNWILLYTLSLLLGSVGMVLNYRFNTVTETVLVAFLLGAVFGAFFCIFIKTRLPEIYDQHRMGLYYDSGVRMNLPGVSFNNSNWPYIVLSGRIWSCAATALYPLLSALMCFLLPQIWLWIELYVFLVLFLGGLFIPIYIVGKKYE